MSDKPILITVEHCEALDYCFIGMGRFAKRYGLDLRDFCKNGIMSDRLPIGNSHTEALVKIARELEKTK